MENRLNYTYSNVNNIDLLQKLKDCRSLAKQHIDSLKGLVAVNDAIKAELQIRLSRLEMDMKRAEKYRENSDVVFFDALLDLH